MLLLATPERTHGFY
ncbi:hypothetical protein LINPERPRIM_LOCUS23665 [Linum perenne]